MAMPQHEKQVRRRATHSENDSDQVSKLPRRRPPGSGTLPAQRL